MVSFSNLHNVILLLIPKERWEAGDWGGSEGSQSFSFQIELRHVLCYMSCGLCCWPKCDQDYMTVPSVKRTLTLEPSFEKTVLILKLISGDKITLNSIYPTH